MRSSLQRGSPNMCSHLLKFPLMVNTVSPTLQGARGHHVQQRQRPSAQTAAVQVRLDDIFYLFFLNEYVFNITAHSCLFC